jgi:hypothetical protein
MTMLTLLSVCEDMFQLNVLNRVKRNQYRFISYSLKNELVKYLYERGYCIEALLHCQKFECWSCSGTGEYWSGETCFKCDGSGVFREVWHYAFRFEVRGRRFSWHQPKTLVDFPVKLTPGLPELYKEPTLPDKEDADLFQRRAGKAIWNIAVFLWLHRCRAINLNEMPVTRETSWKFNQIRYKVDCFVNEIRKKLRKWLLKDNSEDIPF